VPDQASGPGRSRQVDRRQKPRIQAAFPARVWGVDASGRQFELESRIENISSSGLCLELPLQVSEGEQLLAVVKFIEPAAESAAPGSGSESSHARVAVWGPVVRCRARNGGWETAVRFHGHVIA
jgi:hypothetical protein